MENVKGYETPAIATPRTEGVILGIRTPPAPRYRSMWLEGRRIADPSKTFGPYIDVLHDQDFSIQKDPKAYERMMRDCQIRSCFRLRQLSTASRKVEFVSRRKGDLVCENSARTVNDIWQKVRRPTEIICNILDAIVKGVSFQEIVWKLNKNTIQWESESIIPVHKDKFVFSLDGELCLLTPYDIFYGETVPPRVFIHHVYDPEPASFANPESEARIHFGWGEGDRIYPWYIWKMLVLRLGFTYLDRLAFPIRIGRYPYRDELARAEMEKFLQDLDHHRYGCWPGGEGWDFELYQTPATGHNVAMDWISYIDTQIAKLVLGSTLMQDSGDKGSYALGSVQTQNVFGAITESDSSSLCDTLENTWGKWVAELNSLPPGTHPKATQTASRNTSLVDIVDMMLLLSDKGYPISVEQLSETTGFRPARPGETLLIATGMEGNFDLQHGEGSPFTDAKYPQDLPSITDRIGKRPVPHSLSSDRSVCIKGAGRISDTELAKGQEVEAEHTDDPQLAKKIAWDHLNEHPDYYTKLEHIFDGHNLSVWIPPERGILLQDIKKYSRSPGTLYVPARKLVSRKFGIIKYERMSRLGNEHRMAKFEYTNLRRERNSYNVEPYSYRYKRGFVYLYGYDPADRTIKSFFVHKILNLSKGRKFRPRWTVEIGK